MEANHSGNKNTPLSHDTNDKFYLGLPGGGDDIPPVFPAIDNDLAVENLTNDFDMTAADLQDLSHGGKGY